MSVKFCENEMCEFNKIKYVDGMMFVERIENGHIVKRFKRIEYLKGDFMKERSIFFCEICGNAIKIASTK